MKFHELAIGDMFNTLEARYVKVDDEQAVCVMSGVLTVGEFYVINKSRNLVVLWTEKRGAK